KKPQSTKLLANAVIAASCDPASIPFACGRVSIKWLNGSAAAQKTPPAASNVHIIMEIHLNVLISGLSIFPNLILPYFEKPRKSAIKNVPSKTTRYTLPKYLTENANELLTKFVTISWYRTEQRR